MNVTIQDGVDGGIIEDTFMSSAYPTGNYGDHIHFAMNNYYASGGQWGLIKVDLSDYSGVVPLNGKFILTPVISNTASIPAKCTKLLKDWMEATATWNEYDTGLSWEIAGAQETTGETPDRSASTESTFNMLNTGTTDVPITVATITEWLTTNYGAVMDGNSAPTGSYVHAGSSENVGNKPYFYMEYTEAAAGGIPRGRIINLGGI